MIQAAPRLTSVRAIACLCGALIAGPGALIADVAQARDMTGKGGLGVLATTTGTPYLSFRYWRTKAAIEILASYTSHSASDLNAANEPNISDLRVALGVLFRIGDQPRASLSVGVRPWLVYHAETRPSPALAKGGVDRYGIELPLQAEFFLMDNFSLLGTVAANIQLGSTATQADTQLEARAGNGSFLVTVGGGFSGGLGFSYYF